MVPVRFSRLARRDLSAIGLYIGEDSPASARAYVSRLEAHCRLLSTYPSMGVAHDEISRGVRVLPFRRRVNILYRATATEVLILRVLYAGRQG